MIRLDRTVFLTFLWLASAAMAFAQTAPDIARGATSEDVIRAYGWPNGKSTSENREVWLYDEFQVALQNGRVLNVWLIPPDKRQPKRRNALPVDVQSPPGIRPSTRPTSPSISAPAAPLVRSVQPALTPINQESPERIAKPSRVQVPPTGISLADFWPVLAIGCVAIIAIVMMAERRRIAREVEEMTRGASVPPPPPKQTWQESVAASVARATAPVGSQPTTSQPQRPPSVSSSPVSPVSVDRSPIGLTELSYELLDRLEWKRIELIVALYYEQTGVRAECTCIGPDGGIDVQLYRKGEHAPFCYVQCKAMSWKVDVKMVRELFGVMSAAKVTEGIFVTTGRYSKDALQFAARNNIRAISGVDFVEQFNRLPREARERVLSKVTQGDYTTPTCSRCDIKMVLRETEPPQWGCRRCGHRQNIRKVRWSALRSARR